MAAACVTQVVENHETYVQQYASPLRQHAAPMTVDATLQMESDCVDSQGESSVFFDVGCSY